MLNIVSFLKNALPFIIIGVSVIVIVINLKKKDTYLCEGMIFGVMIGAMFGYSFKLRLELCISIGMIVGEAIGSIVVKKK